MLMNGETPSRQAPFVVLSSPLEKARINIAKSRSFSTTQSFQANLCRNSQKDDQGKRILDFPTPVDHRSSYDRAALRLLQRIDDHGQSLRALSFRLVWWRGR